jgi:hypothetical protein
MFNKYNVTKTRDKQSGFAGLIPGSRIMPRQRSFLKQKHFQLPGFCLNGVAKPPDAYMTLLLRLSLAKIGFNAAAHFS